MLISCVITLKPAERVAVPPNLGWAAHGWFLDQVCRADPDLAEALHAGHGQRPFTVSNLLGMGWRSRGEVTLSPEKTYALRITSITSDLSELLRERLLSDPPATVVLADVSLEVTGATTDPQIHPWAGTETYEGLVQRHTLGAGRPSRRVGLRFASPTLFRSSKMNVPVPLPGLVFGSLLDKWNAFAPLQLHPDLRQFAEECLAVSRYRLETRPAAFGAQQARGAVAGCVGDCVYAVRVDDRYWTGLIQLLAGFALYGGVGLHTTMGLGQVRLLRGRR